MAKVDLNEKVKPEFKHLYELLHTGFMDEKLVVPQSWFHDVETSLAPPLKPHIVRYQNYLGQIDLHHPLRVRRYQIARSLERFLGRNKDPLDIEVAFREAPDQRIKQFNITVDKHLERHSYRASRTESRDALERLRRAILDEGLTFAEQLEREYVDHQRAFLEGAEEEYSHLCENRQELLAFGKSEAFRKTPVVSIAARLYAALFTHAPSRVISESDATDIDIMSTYLPYMDVIGTDAFVASQLQSLRIDVEYGVKVFTAKTKSLRSFIGFAETYLRDATRVNRPVLTVFVTPTTSVKEHAFRLFFDLGREARTLKKGEYVEIYGFDDGRMPEYELRQAPGVRLPFYGLQEVQSICIRPNATAEEILDICRQRCKSENFILVDKAQPLPKHFFDRTLLSIGASQVSSTDFPIYSAKSSAGDPTLS